jgi:hypothetical protein
VKREKKKIGSKKDKQKVKNGKVKGKKVEEEENSKEKGKQIEKRSLTLRK